MEEAAETRLSLSSTRHDIGGGRYTNNSVPNADVDAEASAGLLTRDSDAVMVDEEEKLAGKWRKSVKRSSCVCCGVK
jgi:hypothetical protein